ncbi:N(6)-adenine-specific DNA methyltransferase 2 [Phytophthora nicotianae]|uniref:N(6)-adenine-specific DNA methyltransferase 2 n=1 Tax=Phytophthora nicotianae TaxID=4792 RepID=A0A0W8CDW3_PHYNI|nr:N(6)-adenine-specific DNA methyltransferase 2 [Phytophthora nicotianae]
MDELLSSELSAETLAALQAHLLERHQEEDAPVSEDFRLSQLYVAANVTFTHSNAHMVHQLAHSWYDEKTGRALAQEAIDHSSSELKIAFVSTPAAYRDFLKIQSEEEDEAKRVVMGDNVYIFEYDRRFGEKYGDRFCFYDYNAPTDLPEKFHHFFDYVLMEPPHLSPDCLEKFSDTMRWLAKDVEAVPGKKDRVINPSTFINSQLLRKEMKADLGFTPTGFYPSFESKLSNHLLTYTNYESERFGPCEEPGDEEDE